jgi:hypothetical protein
MVPVLGAICSNSHARECRGNDNTQFACTLRVPGETAKNIKTCTIRIHQHQHRHNRHRRQNINIINISINTSIIIAII